MGSSPELAKFSLLVFRIYIASGAFPFLSVSSDSSNPVPRNFIKQHYFIYYIFSRAAAGIPVGFDEEKCETVYDAETCITTVVEKENHEQECPYTAIIN